MNKYSLGIYVFLFLFIQSCIPESTQNSEAETRNPYYDLDAYFKNEIERLNDSDKEIVKSIDLDGEMEEAKLPIEDFNTELQTFRESHINRVSWWGKYVGDTSYYNNNNIKKIQYKTLDEDLKTKTIRISFNQEGGLDSLFILNSTSSPSINTLQELIYIPDNKYQIYSTEKVLLSKERIITVTGKFSD